MLENIKPDFDVTIAAYEAGKAIKISFAEPPTEPVWEEVVKLPEHPSVDFASPGSNLRNIRLSIRTGWPVLGIAEAIALCFEGERYALKVQRMQAINFRGLVPVNKFTVQNHGND